MKIKKVLVLTLLSVFVTACNNGKVTQIETEKILAENTRNQNPSNLEVEDYCIQNGGHYETWNDGETFCIFSGYGCDPEEFYFGRCGLGI